MNTHVGLMLVATCMLPVAATAQEKKPFVEARGNVVPVRLPPGGPPPRMADGHVDLSGNWFPGPTGKANAWSVVPDPRVPEDPVPFQPWAEAKSKSMTRTELELSSANVTCDPVGTPGMQFTIEDPKVLTKPWTSAWRIHSLANEDLTENFCTNNENVEQLRKLNEIESSGKR